MNKKTDHEDLKAWLVSKSVEILESVQLSEFSWFKTGGVTDLIIFSVNSYYFRLINCLFNHFC